jgi:hypothetical protein
MELYKETLNTMAGYIAKSVGGEVQSKLTPYTSDILQGNVHIVLNSGIIVRLTDANNAKSYSADYALFDFLGYPTQEPRSGSFITVNMDIVPLFAGGVALGRKRVYCYTPKHLNRLMTDFYTELLVMLDIMMDIGKSPKDINEIRLLKGKIENELIRENK